VPGRGRLLVCAAGALLVLVAGCDTAGAPSPDARLTLYVSAPLRGPAGGDGRDVADGARLALEDASEQADGIPVRGVYLDDTAGRGSSAEWSPARIGTNARRAAEDSTAIAYVGDLQSGATRASLPITNQAGMLQVSPASGAGDLVQPSPGSEEVPEQIQTSGERSFGRVIPADGIEGAVGAAWAKRLAGDGEVVVVGDGTPYAAEMIGAFTDEGRLHGLELRPAASLVPPGARCGQSASRGGTPALVYYAGETVPTPEQAGCSLAPDADLIATEAVLDSAFVRRIAGSVRSIRITSGAEDPSQLPPAGRRFVGAFRDRYGRAPGSYAAYGYEAAAVVLDSIDRAEDPTDRGDVIDAFLATSDRESVLGTYSIDAVGDTTLDRLAGYRDEGGRLVFDRPLRAP
jgi:branched-chain amino acid transport system substrate-binding protein